MSALARLLPGEETRLWMSFREVDQASPKAARLERSMARDGDDMNRAMAAVRKVFSGSTMVAESNDTIRPK